MDMIRGRYGLDGSLLRKGCMMATMTANDNRALKGLALDTLAAMGIEAAASDSGSNVISVTVTKTQFHTLQDAGVDVRYAATLAGRWYAMITLTGKNRK